MDTRMTPDPTRNERQRRRREREHKWLKEHGLTSWEALHTKLMNGEAAVTIKTNGGAMPSAGRPPVEKEGKK